MKTRNLTSDDLEGARAEIFHMILFAMAWVTIGEYSLDFRDYLVPAILVLVAVVILAQRSTRFYEIEEELPEGAADAGPEGRARKRTFQRYLWVFLLEGIAIMATWMILLRVGHQDWLVSAFALIAGLHFLPLAWVIKLKSYYWLGVWIIALAILGYFLASAGTITRAAADSVVSYGCAAGAIADGIWIATMRGTGIAW